MNSPAGAHSRIIHLILLCLCFHRVSAQVVPVAGSRVDSASQVRHDTLSIESASPARHDTLRIDSASHARHDTLRVNSASPARHDTVRVSLAPIPMIGSIERTSSPEQIIDDSMINFLDYRSLGDILTMMPGVFIQELGSAGQLDRLTVQGLGSIAFMSNGISLNEPFTELFDMHLYSMENVERIEVIQGTRAFLYALNSTGGAINIVPKSRKAIHPYTRIHYDQSADNYSVLDGSFSQDILRGLNLTGGIEHSSFGGRFLNSDEDGWNGRIYLRYNISNTVNIFASDVYNQTQVGLNGGVNPSTPKEIRFNPQLDTVLNTDAYEKVTRNDVQVGAALRLLKDSSAITTLTLFRSANLREYRDEENRPNPNGIFVRQDHRSRWYGAKLSHQMVIAGSPVDVGAEVQSRGVVADNVIGQHLNTSLSAYGTAEFQLSPAVTLTPSSRLDNYLHHTDLSYGGDARFLPTSWFALFAGYSRSFRYPTPQEIYDTVNSPRLSRGGDFPEEHHLVEAGFTLSDQHRRELTVKYFHRQIVDPVDLNPDEQINPDWDRISDRKRIHEGVTMTGRLSLGSLLVEANIQNVTVTDGNQELRFLPPWSGTGGVYYRDKLFENHLDLKTGIRGRAFSAYRASGFEQQRQISDAVTPGAESGTVATIDLLFIAHLGDATIHFVWENFLDRQYVMTYLYPMPDRAIRFGLSWEFTD